MWAATEGRPYGFFSLLPLVRRSRTGTGEDKGGGWFSDSPIHPFTFHFS